MSKDSFTSDKITSIYIQTTDRIAEDWEGKNYTYLYKVNSWAIQITNNIIVLNHLNLNVIFNQQFY